MRIAFFDYVCDPAQPGTTGLSDLVWDMASRLARLGDEVHVVAPYTVTKMPSDSVQVHSFPIPLIGYRNILGHLLIIHAGYRKLRSLGPFDLIHVPEYVSAAVLATLLPSTPVIFTEPGNIYERVLRGNPYDPVTTIVYKLAAMRAATSCTRLVATSEEMAQWWAWTGVRPERIYRLPLGIDASLFRNVPNAKQALGFPDDIPAIVYAARLSRENGIDVALRAVAQLRTMIGPLHFHVLGDGPERQSLAAMSRSLNLEDCVTWHGWAPFDRLPVYYSAADAFVFSGRSGGTPRVLLQAMACAAPVAASAIGGIVDHITHGTTGLLFPSGDSASMAEAMQRLITQKEYARALGQAAEAYVHASVDWDSLVQMLRQDVYLPIVEAAHAEGPVKK